MMKDNYYWILLGVAVGILIYLGDKYIFKGVLLPGALNLKFACN